MVSLNPSKPLVSQQNRPVTSAASNGPAECAGPMEDSILEPQPLVVLTRHLWGGRSDDACGEVTGHPRENTTSLDPRRVVWSYGCILWTCFGAALGSWLAPLGRYFGVGWADEGRDVPLAGCMFIAGCGRLPYMWVFFEPQTCFSKALPGPKSYLWVSLGEGTISA